MRRVLFLYATDSSGHQSAAHAIAKSLKEISPKIQTREIDFFTRHYPGIGRLFSGMSREIVRSVPHAWDYLYDNPNLAVMTSRIRRFFDLVNLPKINTVLKEYKPHAVVCTQAASAGLIASAKETGKLAAPLFAVLTDFVANPYWPERHIDCYFVPAEEIRQSLMKRGIPAERIKTTGIPIDSRFVFSRPKSAARRKLGLKPDAATVLITGGSLGIGNIAKSVSALVRTNKGYQIMVATGRNRALLRRLRKKYSDAGNVILFGYVRDMAILMDAADIMISKPGGLTSAEAMAKGIPMIITSPLPGQEERNASYLIKHGITERCDDMRSLPRIVDGFFDNPNRSKVIRSRSLNLGKPYASLEIANHLLNIIS